MNKPELLAPAGDLERLKFACLYGADAVYIGGPSLGLRANAINFTLEEMKEGVKFAHNLNKKVYVTVNIVLHNKELKEVENYLKELEKCKIDAIIVSDPMIMKIAKEKTNLELHISTQASTMNIETCKFYKELGATRIVLARELSYKEIKEIKENVDIELECFIHGAMCAGISGRCALSNFLTARDANRGGCSQICRWDFDLKDEKLNLIEGEKKFTFCTKDLSLQEQIPSLIDLGISSFKIEGRMRSIYYIATITNIYRRIIDEYWNQPNKFTYNKEYENILRNCANRDAVAQFYNGKNDHTCGYYNGRIEVSNQDFLGIVLEYDEQTKIATLEQRNYFKKGDIVEIFGPTMDIITIKIDEIWDDKNEQIEIVRHPKQVVKLRIKETVHPNDLMRIKKVDKTKNM